MKPTEYEFILPDGSKRYEIVCEPRDVFTFQRMHGSTCARPYTSAMAEEDAAAKRRAHRAARS